MAQGSPHLFGGVRRGGLGVRRGEPIHSSTHRDVGSRVVFCRLDFLLSPRRRWRLSRRLRTSARPWAPAGFAGSRSWPPALRMRPLRPITGIASASSRTQQLARLQQLPPPRYATCHHLQAVMRAFASASPQPRQADASPLPTSQPNQAPPSMRLRSPQSTLG